MKLLTLTILSAVLASSAFADTSVYFDQDEAVITIQGAPGNTDAPTLYNAINASATESSGISKKSISYVTADGEKVLNLTCNLSTKIDHYGSCTLVLYRSKWVDIGTTSAALFLDRGQDSDNVRKLFIGSVNDQIYGSADGKLSIRFDKDSTQNGAFSVVYR